MTTLQELEKKMTELAKFAIPSKNYDPIKADEYYRTQNLYRVEKAKVKPVKRATTEDTEVFVNNYGEATKREITSQTYRNQQKRQSKEMLRRLS